MDTVSQVIKRIVPNRKIDGISAILLPFDSAGRIDFGSFGRQLERTVGAGLTPSVNMDTGYVNLLTAEERRTVLEKTSEVVGGKRFVAGAFIEGEAGDPYALYVRQVETIQAHGGTPILFQCSALKTMGANARQTVPPFAVVLPAYNESLSCQQYI